MQPTNLQAALRYAKHHYPVLPVWWLRPGGVCACSKGAECASPGKHPLLKAWQQQATTDAKQIEKWFTKWPQAHIGIMPPEGHCIIDVDPRNGGDKTLAELMGGEEMPVTPTQRTPGGGWHYVFKGEPNGPLGKGIDVKLHRRGFVVAWPSGHTAGRIYDWNNAPWG